ncbi:SDR family NAD(P)-dependent oxidoreductase [Aestuariivirga sp.]|uniref:SDR family NAD(P)-dependent oxidoreductase n=1 Tax=Aestuariivirga sp. TaxID=2650926 RepID=UPI0025BBDDDE|nr:SDR family oxidoreductase [Aestuariivirga sp.]MCA3554617.1 SDR family oxidoreductase [Aestuariivirga sp.]
MKLRTRTAIVTGAARGIGLAIAERLTKEGASVVLADVLDREGKAAAKRLGAVYKHCDVSKAAEAKALVAFTVRKFGAIDILVNNAAVSSNADFLEVTEAEFDRVIGINLKGSFLMLQASARQMLKQVEAGRKPGAIVNMSSVNDTLAIPGIVTYCMSKGGVSQMTRATSIALAPHGIRVNAIGPGTIDTDMARGLLSDEAAFSRAMSRTPLGRAGTPAEVAAIAAFLVSDEASYITGETIYADGGRMPLNYTVPVKP